MVVKLSPRVSDRNMHISSTQELAFYLYVSFPYGRNHPVYRNQCSCYRCLACLTSLGQVCLRAI